MTEDTLNGGGYSEAADEALHHLRELVALAQSNPGNELNLRCEEMDAGVASISWRWPEDDDSVEIDHDRLTEYAQDGWDR